MRFGVFAAPFHAAAHNPVLAIQDDLALVEHLDRLGYDEAWIGEHRSGGWEIIGCPEAFIAAAAQRTTRIRLATGVTSLPFHHPFVLADRIVFLDNLTRGRVIFGVGPGALPTDLAMIGVPVSESRRMMEESLEAMLALLRADEPVSRKTDWFELHDAQLQLRPVQRPCFEVVVTSVASPSGPRLAGRLGTGLLSVAATSEAGFAFLAETWRIVVEEAALQGRVPDRGSWRLAGPMHIAASEEQARRDVAYGLRPWIEYTSSVTALGIVPPGAAARMADDELVDVFNASGWAVIGTPEMARSQLRRLRDQTGGFGAFLLLGHDWADREATFRSYELIAREVFPELDGSVERRQVSYAATSAAGDESRTAMQDARATAAEQYARELQARTSEP